MWQVKRPKSQEKNKTRSPVWKSRGWGLTGLRMTAGRGVNLRSRGSHTLLLHTVSVCVFIHLYVSLCLCAGATEAKGIRHPESWGYRSLRAAQSVCRELNSGFLQVKPMLFPAPVGSQTRRGGKWRKCLGYWFIKVMASNPIVVQPRFHYRQSLGKKKKLKTVLTKQWIVK